MLLLGTVPEGGGVVDSGGRETDQLVRVQSSHAYMMSCGFSLIPAVQFYSM